MEGADFLPIKVWDGIRSALCSGVDTVSDYMSMEFAVSLLDECHGTPMRHTPKGGTKYRSNKVSRTHATQRRATEKEKRINPHDGFRRVQLHRAKVRGAAS